MQPYFLPYIGYWQLINAVDKFVIYDEIKYTKKGWINRNRILLNGCPKVFSLPLKKDSDYLNVVDRQISSDFDHRKLLKKFRGAYAQAPYFGECFPLLESLINFKDKKLFNFILNSLTRICSLLSINTKIINSSTLAIPDTLRGQDKVITLCKSLDARTYINPIGGTDLYSGNEFRNSGLNLQFIKSNPPEYSQFSKPFVPWLSIIDLLMFNPLEKVMEIVRNDYELL
jgi:hypothetical protein